MKTQPPIPYCPTCGVPLTRRLPVSVATYLGDSSAWACYKCCAGYHLHFATDPVFPIKIHSSESKAKTSGSTYAIPKLHLEAAEYVRAKLTGEIDLETPFHGDIPLMTIEQAIEKMKYILRGHNWVTLEAYCPWKSQAGTHAVYIIARSASQFDPNALRNQLAQFYTRSLR